MFIDEEQSIRAVQIVKHIHDVCKDERMATFAVLDTEIVKNIHSLIDDIENSQPACGRTDIQPSKPEVGES